MEVKLPLEKPFITTFPKDANAVSILLTYEKSYPWLMNNFIQLTSWDNEYLDYFDFHYRDCPMLKYQRIMRDVVDKLGVQFDDFIKSMIDSGYYVIVPADTTKIAEYSFAAIHDMLIYGYGDDLFYIADVLKGGKYCTGECTTEELLQATAGMTDRSTWGRGFYGNLELLTVTKKSWAKLELKRIKQSLTDYLSSSPTSCWPTSIENWKEDEWDHRVYGLQCYDTLVYHMQKLEMGEMESSGIRAFHLMWEHKKTMCKRIDVLGKEIEISDELREQFIRIERMTHELFMLVLKGLVKSSSVNYDRMRKMVEDIKMKEEISIKEILDCFKRK